jgi:hypothetical protein
MMSTYDMIRFMTPVRYEGYEERRRRNRRQDASKVKQTNGIVVYNVQRERSEVKMKEDEW